MTKAEIINYLVAQAEAKEMLASLPSGNAFAEDVTVLREAAKLIESLSIERDAWQRRAEAAERDIDHCCPTCQYHHMFFNGCTYDHDCTNPDGACSDDCDRWHWRGPCKENGGEQ